METGRLRRTFLGSLAAGAAFAAGAARSLYLGRHGAPQTFFHRGVNFTAEWPDVYRSPRAFSMLSSLPGYGVNSIALVPYGFTALGSTSVRFGGRNVWESDASILEMSAAAHKLGLKVLLKPQIWLRGGYPGDIELPEASGRREWFRHYRVFIEHHARLAAKADADLFCVGVEFSQLAAHEAEWRSIIAGVRGIYSGPLVYAANFGPEFETLRFWDALDFIGLNNYYPLPDDLSTDTVVAKVERVQRAARRPVLFTEAGFASLVAPHRKPWDESPRALSPRDQARCYEAIFRAFYRKPWLHGIFWWKVGTNGFGGPSDGSHTPWGKPAMEVLSRWYREGGR